MHNLEIPHFNSTNYTFNGVKKYTNENIYQFQNFFDNGYNYDFIVATTYSIASLLNEVKVSAKKIVWEHTHFYGYCDPIEHYSGVKGWLRKVYNTYITHPQRAKLYNNFNSVIVLTHVDKSLNWDKYHSNVVAIHNPLTLSKSFPVNTTRKNQFISIGRLTRQKGHSYLIDAFYQFLQSNSETNYKLLIVGDGPLREKLQEKIQYLNLEKHVFLLGLRNDVSELLAESKVYLSSAIYEGFGLVLVEAQSQGLPIIAFDCLAGPREIISNDNGILVENRSTKELAKQMLYLTQNEDVINNMSLSSLNNVEKFNIVKISQKWKLHLESLNYE